MKVVWILVGLTIFAIFVMVKHGQRPNIGAILPMMNIGNWQWWQDWHLEIGLIGAAIFIVAFIDFRYPGAVSLAGHLWLVVGLAVLIGLLASTITNKAFRYSIAWTVAVVTLLATFNWRPFESDSSAPATAAADVPTTRAARAESSFPSPFDWLGERPPPRKQEVEAKPGAWSEWIRVPANSSHRREMKIDYRTTGPVEVETITDDGSRGTFRDGPRFPDNPHWKVMDNQKRARFRFRPLANKPVTVTVTCAYPD